MWAMGRETAGMDAKTIETLIKQGIPGAAVQVQDLRGDGRHYAAVVVSAVFEGKALVEQHRMVHAALGSHLEESIHALQIKTRVA